MNGETAISPQRIRERLAGQHLLITGSTGFLAKAFVEKLLRSVDTVGGLHLLVRPRSDGVSPRDRVAKEVLRSRVFDRLRASLGEGFARRCDEKIHVVGGDLTRERFGLEPAKYRELTRRITMVVNSAATVTFDERLDEAVELNTIGPSRLLKFARECGDAPMMHISTCYVCGVRRGVVVEDFSAPESARESLPRLKTGEFDLDGIVRAMVGEAEEIRLRFGADTEACRRELIDAGMRWARSHGWNDTYTFTKWIGEQLLVRDRGSTPLVVFRPAIIESSYEEPLPGWIDGLRMADPIIVAYGRGKLTEFPAREDIPIDVIPVDYVANAMIAALPAPSPLMGEGRGEGETFDKRESHEFRESSPPLVPPGRGDCWSPTSLAVYQCGSSERNPLLIGGLRRALERSFEQSPMQGDDGKPIHPGPLRMISQEEFLARWETKQRRVAAYRRWLSRLGFGERRMRKLTAIARQVEQVIYFAKIYSPYTHLDCRFADDGLRQIAARLHPDDRETFNFDTRRIDWDDYIVKRHVPGLLSFVLGAGSAPSARLRGAVEWQEPKLVAQAERPGETIFSVFARTAAKLPTKTALQIRRDGKWTRYSFDDLLRATGTVMRRLLEYGLLPGDRVAICGENGPEWGLMYLSLMRGGLTAVPFDSQLSGEDIWAAARYAKARLVCAGPSLYDKIAQARGDGDVEIVRLGEPFIPPAGASRDREPDPVPVDDTAIASILFTSGTTVNPKAVPLTHRNLVSNATALLRVQPIHPSDEMLSVLPIHHVFEFTGGFLVPMVCGATVTYVEQLKGAAILSAMQATGTTIMLAVPRLLKMFHDSIENGVTARPLPVRLLFRMLGVLSDWSGHRLGRRLFGSVHRQFGGHIRMLVSGGSSLDPQLFRSFSRMGFPVYEGYGLTETSPALTLNPPGGAKIGSVGLPLANVELVVRNKNSDGIGEIWARGPSVMAGYLDNKESTNEIITDGWIHTGDLGREDEEGYIFLTGRSKDLIVTAAGKNVYPDEVETRYKDVPYVKEFCVFGLPVEGGLGDAVHAVTVVDEAKAPELDRSSIEREIRSAVEVISAALPSHQRVSSLHLWYRELPKTSTLKAKRGVIREMVVSGGGSGAAVIPSVAATSSVAESKDDVFAAIRRIIGRQAKRPEESIHRDMHLLLDLGIDSIGKVDLIGEIESQFAMRVEDEQAGAVARVSDLVSLVGKRAPTAQPSWSANVWRRITAAAETSGGNGHTSSMLAPARWLVRGTVTAFMHSYIRVETSGVEKLPARGAFIIAANHSSHLDAPAVITAIGGSRRIWVAGAQDYFFDTPVKRFVFGKLLDTIAFDRHADGVAGLRRCGGALAGGDGLLMFPEGTRSRDGRMQPFKVGVAVLAMEHCVPIVPAYIEAASELLPKGSRFVRSGRVKVSFGRPIAPPQLTANLDQAAARQELTLHIQEAVEQLASKRRQVA